MTRTPRSGDAAIRLAVLDDYHGAAPAMADWSGLCGRCAITVFDDHLADEDAIAAVEAYLAGSPIRVMNPEIQNPAPRR